MVSRTSFRVIEGRQHPLVKGLRAIVRSGELLAGGSVLLETVRMIEEAVSSGRHVSKLFISRAAGARARGLLDLVVPATEVYDVSPTVFDSLVSTQSSQGVLALVPEPAWSEKDLFPGAVALVLVAAGLQDPGNLGAMIRTAEAFGATGIILTEGTVSPYNAKAIRATAGSLLRLPMLRDLTCEETLAVLRRHRVPLFAAVSGGANRLSHITFEGSAAIAIGSEGAGLPHEMLAAGEQFTIPISPSVESLNAATAAAVVLYEIARQRRDGKP